MPRALLSTFSASTLPPQQFQLFQPIGGVNAIVSPATMRNFFSFIPLPFVARSVTTCSPGDLSEPVISPDLESSLSPEGRSVAENLSGRSPVAGIRYRNGAPGRTPKMDGPLIRGVAAGLGVR